MKKSIYVVAIICLMVSMLSGFSFFCPNNSFSSANQETKGLVAFSQSGMENEWRAMNTKEMESAVRAAGYDFVWTNANGDPGQQLSDV